MKLRLSHCRTVLTALLLAGGALLTQTVPAQTIGGEPVRLSLQKIDKQIGTGAEVCSGLILPDRMIGQNRL